MRRFKITFIICVIVLMELGLTYYLWISYKGGVSTGEISSFYNYLIDRKVYLSIVPMLFGISGLFLNRSLGWILTASFLYYLLTLGIAATIKNGVESPFELILYGLFMSPIIVPLVILNDKDFKVFFGMSPDKSLLRENIISLGSMAICGNLIIWLN